MFDDMFEDDDDYIDAGDDIAGAASSAAEGLLPPRESTLILGMDTQEKLLLSLYNQATLPHALIFAGQAGVGKATMAFRLTRFLLKHSAGSDDQGGLFGDAPPPPVSMDVAADDPVFRKVASGGHPDLRTIERLEGKTGVDIDSVREIAPFLRKTTADGGWRIVIVDEADTMTRAAQNAILKILEEPPPRALLILICNRLGAMIPTIRSRCRTFHFAPLAPHDLADLLRRAAPETPESERFLLSTLADGSAGAALALLEEGGVNSLRTVIAQLENWPDWNWSIIHPMADNLSRKEAEKSYRAFVSAFDWTVRHFVRARATGDMANLPEILSADALKPLLSHYSLEQWIVLCEKLREHFTGIDTGNLDRRHGVIGAFAILGGQI